MTTRREFVVGAAGTLFLPYVAAARRRRRLSADVGVVGAGLAGLSAAREVAAAGRHVVVLEAQRRVGGRIQNHRVAPGVILELGAEFVGPTQDHVLALAAELGIPTFKTYNQGACSSTGAGRFTRQVRASPTIRISSRLSRAA